MKNFVCVCDSLSHLLLFNFSPGYGNVQGVRLCLAQFLFLSNFVGLLCSIGGYFVYPIFIREKVHSHTINPRQHHFYLYLQGCVVLMAMHSSFNPLWWNACVYFTINFLTLHLFNEQTVVYTTSFPIFLWFIAFCSYPFNKIYQEQETNTCQQQQTAHHPKIKKQTQKEKKSFQPTRPKWMVNISKQNFVRLPIAKWSLVIQLHLCERKSERLFDEIPSKSYIIHIIDPKLINALLSHGTISSEQQTIHARTRMEGGGGRCGAGV